MTLRKYTFWTYWDCENFVQLRPSILQSIDSENEELATEQLDILLSKYPDFLGVGPLNSVEGIN